MASAHKKREKLELLLSCKISITSHSGTAVRRQGYCLLHSLPLLHPGLQKLCGTDHVRCSEAAEFSGYCLQQR